MDFEKMYNIFSMLFFFFFFYRMPVCGKRTKKGRDLSASPSTIPMSKN